MGKRTNLNPQSSSNRNAPSPSVGSATMRRKSRPWFYVKGGIVGSQLRELSKDEHAQAFARALCDLNASRGPTFYTGRRSSQTPHPFNSYHETASSYLSSNFPKVASRLSVLQSTVGVSDFRITDQQWARLLSGTKAPHLPACVLLITSSRYLHQNSQTTNSHDLIDASLAFMSAIDELLFFITADDLARGRKILASAISSKHGRASSVRKSTSKRHTAIKRLISTAIKNGKVPSRRQLADRVAKLLRAPKEKDTLETVFGGIPPSVATVQRVAKKCGVFPSKSNT